MNTRFLLFLALEFCGSSKLFSQFSANRKFAPSVERNFKFGWKLNEIEPGKIEDNKNAKQCSITAWQTPCPKRHDSLKHGQIETVFCLYPLRNSGLSCLGSFQKLWAEVWQPFWKEFWTNCRCFKGDWFCKCRGIRHGKKESIFCL